MVGSVLRTEPVADPDGLTSSWSRRIGTSRPEESELLNSKLVLLLANHLGEPEVVAAALAAARDGSAPSAPASAEPETTSGQ